MKNFLKVVPFMLLLSSCIPGKPKYGDKPENTVKTYAKNKNTKLRHNLSADCNPDCIENCLKSRKSERCCLSHCCDVNKAKGTQFSSSKLKTNKNVKLKQNFKNADSECAAYHLNHCHDRCYEVCRQSGSPEFCCNNCCEGDDTKLTPFSGPKLKTNKNVKLKQDLKNADSECARYYDNECDDECYQGCRGAKSSGYCCDSCCDGDIDGTKTGPRSASKLKTSQNIE